MIGSVEPPARRVLITGAGGALGSVVARVFDAAGWQVRALMRRPSGAGRIPAHTEVIIGDLFDETVLRASLEGADAVVHLAALLHIVDAPPSMTAEYTRVNVEGTRRLLSAARAAGVARLIHASTIAVYGAGGDRLIDERDLPRPDSPYAESKLESERVVLNAGGAHPSATVVLRLAAVYGAGVKGNYETLVRRLKSGRFLPVGAGANRRTLIHEDDAARAFLLAAEHPAAAGRILNVTDGAVHSVAEIVTAICQALGRPEPRLQIPVTFAYAAAAAAETVFGLAGRRSPVTRATLGKYMEDVRVSGRAIADDLGFRPRWSLGPGWNEAVQALVRQGRI